TYPLPEAQLDRFMFNIWLDYPSFDEEINIVKATTADFEPTSQVILNAEEIQYFQNLIRRIPVPDNVYNYAVKLVSLTRPGSGNNTFADNYLTWGAGPRASQYLIIGAKCHAAIHGKYSPDIEDVKAVATTVLRHRIVRNYKAEAEGIRVENIIEDLIQQSS
ncbi:MAG: MoxR family ATPase, partial [Bacteroidales bacterium]|nr:MoxR family ATPase [Bacteroidales bacterium]